MQIEAARQLNTGGVDSPRCAFDLVKSYHGRRAEDIIVGWLGKEKERKREGESPPRKNAGKRGGCVLLPRCYPGAMGYIPEAGFTSGRRVRDRR